MSVAANPFPDVPLMPGVPPVPRNTAFPAVPSSQPVIPLNADGSPAAPPAPPIDLMTQDGSDVNSFAGNYGSPGMPTTATGQWGIFDQSGNAVIVADSVVSVEFRKDYDISTYPVEQGSFQSYNKVETPFQAKMTFACGGSAVSGSQYLTQIAAATASLGLYNVCVPEFTYPSANITHYDWKRTAQNGATLLVVDVWAEEVRVTATQSFTNTQTPSGASPTNDGVVQAQQPTAAQLAPFQTGGVF